MITADPIFEKADRLAIASAEREIVLRREPKPGTKGYHAWDKEQKLAHDKDWSAYYRLIDTVPQSSAGAVALINAFLGYSATEDIIEEFPCVRQLLENLRKYLRFQS